MKARIATFGLSLVLVTPAVFAQNRQTTPPTNTNPFTRNAAGAASSPNADPKIFPVAAELPVPTPDDQIKKATIVLPTDDINPWLLTRDAGPFMVVARTFRGPDAQRYALALAKELRNEYNLPAYIMRTKDFPNRSNLRGVPPLAPDAQRRSQLTEPEKVRSYDEAAVLVGNEKTLDGSEKLLLHVKQIKPKCLNEIPSIFGWRNGLKTALRTTNPYVPTQDIFPGRGKRDHIILQMNSGPRSVYKCPGRYTLQVAEYTGLAMFNPDQKSASILGNEWLKKSPLRTAADDAERLAEAIAKNDEIRRAGVQAYVYHDRNSSKVMIGSFNDPKDPAAAQLHATIMKLAIPIAEKTKGAIIAPANALTDLQDPMQPIKLTSAP